MGLDECRRTRVGTLYRENVRKKVGPARMSFYAAKGGKRGIWPGEGCYPTRGRNVYRTKLRFQPLVTLLAH